jgi:adenosylcobinamide-phosphate synthase
MRDRLKHASPNSAHTESFAAGALNIKLGGPARYFYGIVDKPWLGDGTPAPSVENIRSACRLILHASWISILLSCIILFVFN